MPRLVPDPTGLQRITAHYLEHRDTSASHLARLLRGRIRRCVDYDAARSEDYESIIRAEVARLVGLGLIDDARYAESRTRTLRRKGASARKIRAALGSKGLRGEVVDEVLTPADGEDPELDAARTWARKHRVGAWRVGPLDPDLRRKELARMARNGFGYALAVRVVDAVHDEDEA